jgi:nucleotide-binding universal stress UspA family protein
VVKPTDPYPHPEPVSPRWSPFEAAEPLLAAYPDLPITVEQVSDQPLPALLAAADRTDLLVLGSRGASAAAGFLLGSVALTVAGQSPVPVVLVRAGEESGDEHRPDAEGNPATTAPYRDVVLGLDLERPDERVIEFAFDAAARRAATLRVVHGWNAPLPDGTGSAGAEAAVRAEPAGQAGDVLEQALRPWREKYPHTEVAAEAVVGTPGRHLLDAATNASLLVLGRRSRATRVSLHLGSVSHTVLHHALVPVAVVPHD